MIKSLVMGERWACLEVIKVDRLNEDAEPYGPSTGKFYRLKCMCGNEFPLDKRDYRGKRLLKDCGCGINGREGSRVIMSLYVPLSTRERVFECATQMGYSTSIAAAEMMDCGYMTFVAMGKIEPGKHTVMGAGVEPKAEPEPERKAEPAQVWDDGSSEWEQK